jgi:membrane protease YdiL (CAAX protease family)
MHGERGMPALRRLGWGLPDARVLGIAVAVSGALLASMPLIFRLAGVDLIVPSNWLLLMLSIFLMNGIAEETIYRGYLFRRLRERYRFRSAVLLGTLLAVVAHTPIVLSAGPVLGSIAILVSAMTFLPFALLFERGGNTIWAPAVVHFAADCIIPLGVLGLAPPLAIGYWMCAQILAVGLAGALTYAVSRRTADVLPAAARA